VPSAMHRRARQTAVSVIELDPSYAAARALLADALYSQAILGWTEFPDRELSRAADEARKAITLAPDEPDGYRALGHILLARGEYDQARNALKRAIEINPSDANALASWGTVQSFSGEIAGAIDSLQLALKLDPTLEPNYVFDLAVAYYLARRHEDALRIAERGLARYPNFAMFNAPAAAAAAQLGRKEQAAGYVEELRRRLPVLTLAQPAPAGARAGPRRHSHSRADHHQAALRRAAREPDRSGQPAALRGAGCDPPGPGRAGPVRARAGRGRARSCGGPPRLEPARSRRVQAPPGAARRQDHAQGVRPRPPLPDHQRVRKVGLSGQGR
jgi:tetratricopeptide (TPR) repeat protein